MAAHVCSGGRTESGCRVRHVKHEQLCPGRREQPDWGRPVLSARRRGQPGQRRRGGRRGHLLVPAGCVAKSRVESARCYWNGCGGTGRHPSPIGAPEGSCGRLNPLWSQPHQIPQPPVWCTRTRPPPPTTNTECERSTRAAACGQSRERRRTRAASQEQLLPKDSRTADRLDVPGQVDLAACPRVAAHTRSPHPVKPPASHPPKRWCNRCLLCLHAISLIAARPPPASHRPHSSAAVAATGTAAHASTPRGSRTTGDGHAPGLRSRSNASMVHHAGIGVATEAGCSGERRAGGGMGGGWGRGPAGRAELLPVPAVLFAVAGHPQPQQLAQAHPRDLGRQHLLIVQEQPRRRSPSRSEPADSSAAIGRQVEDKCKTSGRQVWRDAPGPGRGWQRGL